MKTLIKRGPWPPEPVEIRFEPSPDHALLLRVTRRSNISGKDNTMDLPITEAHLTDWLGTDQNPHGRLIQDAMPHLSADQRDFLIMGATPEEYAAMDDDEEGDNEPDDAGEGLDGSEQLS